MSESLTVSVVVVNFNGDHYLPMMMEALEATGYPFLEIIVSDDCSKDGSLLYLRHEHPTVRVVSRQENGGPGAARNSGLHAAKGDLVLFLDNDGHPMPDAIQPMVDALAQHPEASAVMPRIILKGPPRLVHCDGGGTHISGQMWLLNSHVPEEDAVTPTTPITSLMATGMMVRRRHAQAIDGFCEDYFIYYEDHEFGTVLFLNQGPILNVPESQILHLEGTKDLSFRTGSAYTPRRAAYTARNRILFGLKVLQGRTLLALFPMYLLHELAQGTFSLLKGWGEHYFQGWAYNLRNLGRTLRDRERIQKHRRVSDRELLVPGPLPLHPGLMKSSGPLAFVRRSLEATMNLLFRLGAGFLKSDSSSCPES